MNVYDEKALPANTVLVHSSIECLVQKLKIFFFLVNAENDKGCILKCRLKWGNRFKYIEFYLVGHYRSFFSAYPLGWEISL